MSLVQVGEGFVVVSITLFHISEIFTKKLSRNQIQFPTLRPGISRQVGVEAARTGQPSQAKTMRSDFVTFLRPADEALTLPEAAVSTASFQVCSVKEWCWDSVFWTSEVTVLGHAGVGGRIAEFSHTWRGHDIATRFCEDAAGRLDA